MNHQERQGGDTIAKTGIQKKGDTSATRSSRRSVDVSPTWNRPSLSHLARYSRAERGAPTITMGRIQVAVWRTTDRVISPMACRVVPSVISRAILGIAGRMTRPIAGDVTGLIAVRVTGDFAEEAHPRIAVGITLQTMSEIILPTKDQTMVRTTSRTIRGVIPRAGVGTFGRVT